MSCASADNTSTGEYTINDDYNDIYNNVLNFRILKSNDLLKRHVFSYYLSLQCNFFLFGKTLYSFETSKTKPTSGKLTFKSDLQTVLSIWKMGLVTNKSSRWICPFEYTLMNISFDNTRKKRDNDFIFLSCQVSMKLHSIVA